MSRAHIIIAALACAAVSSGCGSQEPAAPEAPDSALETPAASSAAPRGPLVLVELTGLT